MKSKHHYVCIVIMPRRGPHREMPKSALALNRSRPDRFDVPALSAHVSFMRPQDHGKTTSTNNLKLKTESCRTEEKQHEVQLLKYLT